MEMWEPHTRRLGDTRHARVIQRLTSTEPACGTVVKTIATAQKSLVMPSSRLRILRNLSAKGQDEQHRSSGTSFTHLRCAWMGVSDIGAEIETFAKTCQIGVGYVDTV